MDRTLALGISALLMWAVCGCAASAPATGELDAESLRKSLVADEWRVFGSLFQSMPADGFPIQFLASGEVRTASLAAVETWSIDSTGTLRLHDGAGQAEDE